MADADESRPVADRAESARRARSNYVLFLVGTGLGLVASVLLDDSPYAADWVFPVAGSLGLMSFIVLVIVLVRAYGDRKTADETMATHFRVQIRTFWISWLYAGINVSVLVILAEIVPWLGLINVASEMVGYAIHLWFAIRCVKGLRYLSRQELYPNPATWLW